MRIPLYSIALLSAATLAYELLLMRLLSIIQWHHFAYMIISLALLGYGASGSVVAVFYQLLKRNFALAYSVMIGLFAVSAVGCFLVAQALPFNAEELLWDTQQPWFLMALYLILALPFFFAATAIALALSHFSNKVGRLYAADLFGAGLGSLAVIAALFYIKPLQVLVVIEGLALLAVLLSAFELRSRAAFVAAFLAIVMGSVIATIALRAELNVSPYKSLPQMLHITDTKVIAEQSSPLGLLTVIESETIPLRHAPGLSLNATSGPPRQIGLFTDAGNMTVINEDKGEREAFAYLDQMTSALAYHLQKPQQVLVLGAGGGAEVSQALYHQTDKVTAVEINPQLADIVRKNFGAFSGHLYDRKEVELHIDEARGFVTGANQQFDLIQVALFDAFAASASGLYALNESYLYTVEALQTYIAQLKDNGYLSISRWIKLPPRDSLKLFATAIAALEQQGVQQPGKYLVMVRSWQTSTLLIKKSPFSIKEIEQVKQFCQKLGFDVAWYPGMPADEANRYNRLQAPYFYQAASALLDKQQSVSYLENYKYKLDPATDDRPYFFHFFKWSVLPELAGIKSKAGLPLLEWGYLILIATLVQASIASIVLIILPLGVLRSPDNSHSTQMKKWRVLLYFLAIGLGFLFIEIAFIQKFILLLHHPLYAAAVVITGFLVFAALGSLWSQHLAEKGKNRISVSIAVSGIAIMAVVILLFFRFLPDSVLAMSLWQKIPFTLLLIAPLAFLMGMPFPLAISTVGKHDESLVPWAWGVNGCASVISAVLATLLAIQFGFNVVVLLAILLYGVAVLSFPDVANGNKSLKLWS